MGPQAPTRDEKLNVSEEQDLKRPRSREADGVPRDGRKTSSHLLASALLFFPLSP